MFLKILEISQENICVESLFNKVALQSGIRAECGDLPSQYRNNDIIKNAKMSKKTKHGIIIPVKIRLPPSKKSVFFASNETL